MTHLYIPLSFEMSFPVQHVVLSTVVNAILAHVSTVCFLPCRIVRLSSPNLNVVFIVGIILVYLMVVIFGLDFNLVPTEGVSGLCQTRLWLGVIAFTLVYGSILAQTFRVFYILRNIKVAQNKNKIKVVWLVHTLSVIKTIAATLIHWLAFAKYILQTIQEWHLFLLIGVILLIDVLFLLPATAVPSSILKSVLVQLPHSVSTCG